MKIEGYDYIKNLTDHLGKNIFESAFSKDFYWPRQLEIHLPGNHKISCNLNCRWCQGKNFIKTLTNWEEKALDILEELQGKIPFHIYGGAYTEPLLNPYILTFLQKTKKYNNSFGIHTNGTLLNNIEFIEEFDKLANNPLDYLSVSLDGGTPESWAKVKRSDPKLFLDILNGLDTLSLMRTKNNKNYSIKVCYLLNEETADIKTITNIVNILKCMRVDSLRFSIPYGSYNQDFVNLYDYKKNVEDPLDIKYKELLSPFLSKDKSERPYIFYVSSKETNVSNYYFDRCIYHAYQITMGADGNYYKCSSAAAPDAINHKLGSILNDSLFDMINKNKDSEEWSTFKNCFSNGIRCNRMAIIINQAYDAFNQAYDFYVTEKAIG